MSEKKQSEPLKQDAVRRSFFGVKYFYINAETRVRYGLSIVHVGTVYTLQRKKMFWNEVAWTYPKTHPKQSLNDIIDYLKWYEEEAKNEKKSKCLF